MSAVLGAKLPLFKHQLQLSDLCNLGELITSAPYFQPSLGLQRIK
jgi:hypothetical protein